MTWKCFGIRIPELTFSIRIEPKINHCIRCRGKYGQKTGYLRDRSSPGKKTQAKHKFWVFVTAVTNEKRIKPTKILQVLEKNCSEVSRRTEYLHLRVRRVKLSSQT